MKRKYVIGRDIYDRRMKMSVKDLIFRPSVYGIIIKNKKVLLSPQFEGYDFPGGGIELGETLDEALEREVWEETGLKVKRGLVVAAESDFFLPPNRVGKWHTLLLYYLCTNISGTISTAHFEEDEKKYAGKAEWVDLKKINKLKFHNSVDSVEVINRAIKLL
jgi:8-oxo-dGTP pyrophosphatase MutT (NUDIX family)